MDAEKKITSQMRTALAALSLIALTAFTTNVSAESAGSVDSGLAMLAKKIIDKSVAADRKTIAVLPFPNADGSCSVLSTYLVDELILGLFSVPDSPVTIIERSQLEALISEMSIGAGGLLNPETTQKLGSISGVQGLTVGTITVIGDTVRVNARLVDTKTGRTISAAGVTLPRTNAITQLLQQPLSPDVSCGSSGRRGAPNRVATTSVGGGQVAANMPPASTSAVEEYKSGPVSFFLTNISRTGNGQYKVVGTLTNTDKAIHYMSWLAPMALLDEKGIEATATKSVGVLPCMYEGKWTKSYRFCRNWSSDRTPLVPGNSRRFAVTLQQQEKQAALGNRVSFTGRFLLEKKGSRKQDIYPIDFPSVVIPARR